MVLKPFHQDAAVDTGQTARADDRIQLVLLGPLLGLGQQQPGYLNVLDALEVAEEGRLAVMEVVEAAVLSRAMRPSTLSPSSTT